MLVMFWIIKIEQLGCKELLEIKLDKGDIFMEVICNVINDVDSGIVVSIVKVKENEFQLVFIVNSGIDNMMKIMVEGDIKFNDLFVYDSIINIGNM